MARQLTGTILRELAIRTDALVTRLDAELAAEGPVDLKRLKMRERLATTVINALYAATASKRPPRHRRGRPSGQVRA